MVAIGIAITKRAKICSASVTEEFSRRGFGYQLAGPGAPLREFNSEEAGLTWRIWFAGSVGAVIGGDWYHNPFYTRAGASFGLFHAW